MKRSLQSIWCQPDEALKRLIERVNDEACAEDDDARVIDGLLVQLDADDEHRAQIRPAKRAASRVPHA